MFLSELLSLTPGPNSNGSKISEGKVRKYRIEKLEKGPGDEVELIQPTFTLVLLIFVILAIIWDFLYISYLPPTKVA